MEGVRACALSKTDQCHQHLATFQMWANKCVKSDSMGANKRHGRVKWNYHTQWWVDCQLFSLIEHWPYQNDGIRMNSIFINRQSSAERGGVIKSTFNQGCLLEGICTNYILTCSFAHVLRKADNEIFQITFNDAIQVHC